MKKVKILTRFFRENLFDADFLLIQCPYEHFKEEASKILQEDKRGELDRHLKKQSNDYFRVASQYPFDGGGSILWMHPNAKIGSLVHEVVHAAHHLLECRATPLSSDTEETYAYLTERIFEGLIGKSTRKKKRR